MATKPGSYLNDHARELGLVNNKNVIINETKLMQLRFDPTLSIVTAAEYDIAVFEGLAMRKDANGTSIIPANLTEDETAKYIYLGHHEGYGGASQLLMGTLSDKRAVSLLGGHVTDEVSRNRLIEASNNSAAEAYKSYLWKYIDNKIQPARFR